MPSGCYIRGLWILNKQDCVVFSRKFPVVERRWRVACEKDSDDHFRHHLLPYDSELAAAFIERKKREGSARGFGLRVSQSVKGSDSWVDDPITRHVISLHINNEDEGERSLLWPLILHVKGPYSILVSPLVETHHLKSYSRMCNRPDCGSAVLMDDNLSSLLLDLPSITGHSFWDGVILNRDLNQALANIWAFCVAHTIGEIILGETVEPEVVVTASPSVGGLLDSLTGSIGISHISARAKPVSAPVAASSASGTSVGGSTMSDAPKMGSRLLDKDALRSFISTAMPFGTPLDLNYSNISAIRTTGFSSADIPPTDRKQPAWKPYLHRGKQRILFTIHDTIHAAMYDRDEIPDSILISGQVNCRAELEGLPDVSFPLTGLNTARVQSLTFHPCAQVPEHGGDKQAITFSPPLGNFVLMHYQSLCSMGPPVKGFYQLSMVSENEGAFLFRLSLMEGYKAPVEFCTVTMPFSRRRVVSLEGTPSIGTVSYSDHSVDWRVMTNTRSGSGKSIEASFSGTVRFAPWHAQRVASDEDSDAESEASGVNVEDHIMEKMNRDLPAADLDDPFCWQAYNYAKVYFKMTGPSLSGMSIDPKSVVVFPAVKASVEISTQVTSGDYILWNTLGKCPITATPQP